VVLTSNTDYNSSKPLKTLIILYLYYPFVLLLKLLIWWPELNCVVLCVLVLFTVRCHTFCSGMVLVTSRDRDCCLTLYTFYHSGLWSLLAFVFFEYGFWLFKLGVKQIVRPIIAIKCFWSSYWLTVYELPQTFLGDAYINEEYEYKLSSGQQQTEEGI